MNDSKSTDTPAAEDHPQTIKLENNARGGAENARKPPPERPQDDSQVEEASPVPANVELGDDANAVRTHATGAGTMGEATGSGIKPDVGSGTPPDQGALGAGKPPITEEGAEPLGTYTPGGRD